MHRHVAGAFDHHLAIHLPGDFGQLAQSFQFGELRLVVGVGDRAGAQAVAERKGHVVSAHDLADFAEARVDEAVLVARQAPFGDDRTAARDYPGGALRRQRDERQTDACVDREVIDALLGLFYERVAEDFPRQFFGLARDFFEGLIDRHRADGYGRIANDPLARGVNILARGEVHHRVGPPFRRPAHLLDLFFDRRRDGAVADVGVDFDQEVAANRHRFALRVIDVGGNDGAPASELLTDEFGRDVCRYARAEAFAPVLMIEAVSVAVGQSFKRGLPAKVFANGDEFHFGRYNAATGVMHLRNGVAGFCAQRLASQSGKFFELAFGLVARVNGLFN